MKMLLLQMLVALFAVVTLVWGLLVIKKWFAKIILFVSVLLIMLFGYISFLNYESTKTNIIECYKLGGCQNNFSADFIINYEKNILAKKIEDKIFSKTNVSNDTTLDKTERPNVTHNTTEQKPVEEVKMNETITPATPKSERELKLQSIRNKETYKEYK